MLLRNATKRSRAIAGSLLALSAGFGLAACSETTGDEEGTSVEDVQDEDADADLGAETGYDGAYDAAFYDDLDGYEGQTVTVSADVNQIVSDRAFTIAGGDVEELLVVSADGSHELEEGSVVEVTGTVYTAFDLPAIEERLDDDLDDDLFDDWDQEPYIEASSIDTNPDTEDG